MSVVCPNGDNWPITYTLDVDGDDLTVIIERGNSVGNPAHATWRDHHSPDGRLNTTFNGYCEHEIAAILANDIPTGYEFVPEDFALCECY